MNAGKNRCTYVLPIRRSCADRAEAEQFARYFRNIAQAGCEVIVVDGSSPEVFAAHNRAWRDVCRHVAVESEVHLSQ